MRRRSDEDERAMREYLAEGDLISAEVGMIKNKEKVDGVEDGLMWQDKLCYESTIDCQKNTIDYTTDC